MLVGTIDTGMGSIPATLAKRPSVLIALCTHDASVPLATLLADGCTRRGPLVPAGGISLQMRVTVAREAQILLLNFASSVSELFLARLAESVTDRLLVFPGSAPSVDVIRLLLQESV